MNIKRSSNIVLIAAGFATFFGLRAMMSGGLEGHVVPPVMAAVVAVGIGMLWHFILHFVPHLSSTGRRIAGLAAAAAALEETAREQAERASAQQRLAAEAIDGASQPRAQQPAATSNEPRHPRLVPGE
ncbi:MAG: hypothetical protein KIT25_17060 [Enhydrobacter sp.]|nr:MAG: hypothetical protein KIT25_17060 [Enhydrobacter sp.]